MILPKELYSEFEFFNYIGITLKEYNKIIYYKSKMYHEFLIPKGNNKFRIINAPDDRLKYIQHKILDLLNNLYTIKNPVHGFVFKKSIITNANSHLKNNYILNMDIKDFFNTITQNRIIGLMHSFGIPQDLSKIIANLCCLNGALPQGSPASPILSNMVCFKLDKLLINFSKKNRCIYTRYADDITFSSYHPMIIIFNNIKFKSGKLSITDIGEDLKNIFLNNGFTINENKIHFADRNSRKIVTGIKVNVKLNLDRNYIRNIRAIFYSINKHELKKAEQILVDKCKKKIKLENYLKGKIIWIGNVRGKSDPIFIKYAGIYNNIFENKIKITSNYIDNAVWIIESLSDNEKGQAQPNIGSAVFIEGIGLITNEHCVSTNGELLLYHYKNTEKKHTVNVNKVDKNYDLALLNHKLNNNEYSALKKVNKQTIKVNDLTQSVDYPDFYLGDKINIRSGQITSLPTRSNIKLIEVSQQITQGMSGGPLLNADNEIIGINKWGGPTEGRQLAIDIEMLDEFLKER